MFEKEILEPDLLNGRVILVTGASRGIGRAVAKAYATCGATVILLARSVNQLETLYDEIENDGLPTPAIYPFNLATATPKDYQDLMNNIDTHFGRLDGLLHNAALLGTLTPIEHYPIEQWLQVLQVNLTSVFMLTQATLPLLKRSKNASIIFTTADEGIQGKAYWGAYGVSKFGIEGLLQTLRAELETNTQINLHRINPHKVRTKLRQSAYPGENPEGLKKPEELIYQYINLMNPNKIKTKEFALEE